MEGWDSFKFSVVAFIKMLLRNAPEMKKLKETNFRNRIQSGINTAPIFSGFFILFYFIFRHYEKRGYSHFTYFDIKIFSTGEKFSV